MSKLLFKLLTGQGFIMHLAAAAPIAGAVVSGAMSSNSADNASKSNAKATKQANERLDRVAAETKQSFAPEINSGNSANALLSDYLGLDVPSQGYNFAQNDYDLALKEYNQLLNTPAPSNKDVTPMVMATIPFMNPNSVLYQGGSGGGANSAALQAAKARLDSARNAMQNASGQYQPRSSNFGSLLKNFDNSDFVQDPGYKFRLDEGLKGIDRATAARGGYDSGATLKALAKYNQDYASNEFGNAFNRDSTNKSRIYDFLSGVTNRGTGAKNTVASTAVGAANNAGNNLIAGANQQGAYQVAGAAGMNNAIQSGIGNYLYDQRVNQPTTSNPGGYTTTMPTYSSGSTSPWYLN